LFDVVEHLSDPLAVFREARRIVKPGGWMILGTGNAGSFAARASGNRWTYICLPEHLSFFTRRALRNGLAKVGFSQIHFQRLHHGEMHYSVASGWLRAVGKHWALTLFGEDIVRLRIFHHKTTEFLVPYFFDHMICIAR
jgi:2-polyprenyl-3-methyl-5-hydroxy-6-metoxy-1,4-benzoquinol methylase